MHRIARTLSAVAVAAAAAAVALNAQQAPAPNTRAVADGVYIFEYRGLPVDVRGGARRRARYRSD